MGKLHCKFDELDKLYCKFDEFAKFGCNSSNLQYNLAIPLNSSST